MFTKISQAKVRLPFSRSLDLIKNKNTQYKIFDNNVQTSINTPKIIQNYKLWDIMNIPKDLYG